MPPRGRPLLAPESVTPALHRDVVKLLIVLMAMAAAGAGALHSWHTRNLFVQAALLSEAFNLSAHVKLRVADHYVRNGSMPHSNADAELPPPNSIYGTSVKRVAINRGGVLIVDFDQEIGRQAMTFTPTVSPVSGLLSWNCTSDSIDPDVLEKLKPSCHYLPATLESQLMHAIANKDLPRVDSLLERGARSDAVVNGNTPLMLSARIGELSVVERLLAAGADVDNAMLNSERRTPLMVAITSDHPDVVGLLLSHGASVTRKDYRGLTALDHAIATDRRLGGERYQLLTSARLNPRFAGQLVERATTRVASDTTRSERLQKRYLELRQAARDCHVQRLATLFREAGDLANPEVIDGKPLAQHTRKPACRGALAAHLKTKSSYQAAVYARFNASIQQCNVAQVRALLRENPMLDALREVDGQSGLARSIAAGCAQLASELIRHQDMAATLPDAVLLDAIRQSPQASLVQLVGSLIEAGANVNGRDTDGQGALGAAISLEQPVVAKYLVDAGADVNAPTANGSWPLIEASKKGYDHLVSQLLSAGAHIDSRDDLGRTALHAAVAKGRNRLVDTLLRAGANARLRDNNGIDAILLADSRNQRQIKQLLTASTELSVSN